MPKVNNRRIATNAMYMYIRTLVSMVIMLYSSRVILNTLGVEDFGIYSLVGSVIAMFTSLKIVFASATQRFLNYEKGAGDINKLAGIFRASRNLHIYVCIIFVIIVEILGIWLINHKLNIPIGRINEAHIVLQCSILSTVIMIITIPYNAILLANEKFNIYAFLSILEHTLKLGAAFLVLLYKDNKLVYYALSILVISVLIRVLSTIYCTHKFPECRVKAKINRSLYKEMGVFAGWNFLGNFALYIYNEGINMILNIFGGVTANAARAISTNVFSGITSVTEGSFSAFAPQTTQAYAAKEYERFKELIYSSTKIISSLYIIVGVPIFHYTSEVLSIWLGEIPEYAIVFTKAMIVYGYVRALHSPLDLCIKCYGKLKTYQIIEICSLLPSLPLAYIMLRGGMPLYWAFLAMIICNTINNIAVMILAQRVVSLNIVEYIRLCILPSCIVVALSALSEIFLVECLHNIFLRVIISVTVLCILSYYIILSKSERGKIKDMLKKFIKI